MRNGTIYTGYSNYTRFYLSWSLAQQDIANNRSLINWTAGLNASGLAYWYSNAIRLNSVSIAGSGNLASGTWSNITLSGGQHLPLRSGSLWVGHDSAGNLNFGGSVSGWLYGGGNLTASGSWSLPTIPRNSQVTTNDSGNYHIGTPLTIYTNRKSSSFTHTITINLNNSGGPEVARFNSVGASVVWRPTTAQINQIQNSIPNANRARLHITQYNNQVRAYSSTAVWNYIRDAQPNFSNFTYRDTNSSTVAVTGSDQVLVKGMSTLETRVSQANRMTAIKGANPSHYTFSFDGTTRQLNYSSSGDVVTSFSSINTTGARTIITTAFDSRGNNRSVSRSVTVYDYARPTLTTSLTRQNNFDNNTTVKISGNYSRLVIGGENKNELTTGSLQYRYREQGGTWGSWVTRSFTANTADGTFSTPDFVVNLDNTKRFDFEFRISDKLATVTSTRSVDVGLPLVFMGENNGKAAIGVGVMPASGVALQVGNNFKVDTSGNVDFATLSPAVVGVIHFSDPTNGQVFGANGGHLINYNAITTPSNSGVTRVGNAIRVPVGGYYSVTANLRIIDVPVPILHMLEVSTNNGSSWSELMVWTPSQLSQPDNTGRNIPAHKIMVELPAGARIRHRLHIGNNPTRIGGFGAFGKYHSSLSVHKIGF